MTPQEFLRDFGHFIDAPNGIQKLRAMVLQLAVQGKLVAQDPKDEPASIKENLSKKTRKGKEVEPIDLVDSPFDLPSGWDWKRLASLGEWTIGSGFPKNIQGYSDKPYLFCKVSDMNLPGNEKFIHSTVNTVDEDMVKSKKIKLHPEGSVVFPKIGGAISTNKRRILVKPTAIDNNCLGIYPSKGCSTDWLYLQLSSIDLMQYQSGTSVPALSQGVIGNIITALPPLAEQHRIVAKVDELMALCDQLETERNARQATHQRLIRAVHHPLTEAADANATGGIEQLAAWHRIRDNFADLYTTLESVQALRQTILQLAVQGKLVEQNPDAQPASDLVEEIKAEKDSLIKNKAFKKTKVPPAIENDEIPFNLPDCWEWERLGNVVYQITDGAHHTPTYVPDGVPFLSVKDMSSGHLNFSNTRYISKEQHAELSKRCNPKRGDLLLTKVGTTGIPILVDTDIEFSIFVSVALIKFNQNKLIGNYLRLLINSPVVKNQSEEGTEGVGNKNLVLRKINSFLIAIPPLEEQCRIVAKVNELMALCDQLEANIRDKNDTVTRYAEAIVQQIAAA